MALRKLSGADGFVVIDLDDAPGSAGLVRLAPKILLSGAKELARSATYTFAAVGMRRSGASGGINTRPDGRDQALAAFLAECEPWVVGDEFLPEAGKGLSHVDLAPLTPHDPRHPIRLSTAGGTGGDSGATVGGSAVGGSGGRESDGGESGSSDSGTSGSDSVATVGGSAGGGSGGGESGSSNSGISGSDSVATVGGSAGGGSGGGESGGGVAGSGGGITLSERLAGRGAVVAAATALGGLEGRRIVIEGCGASGIAAAEAAAEHGAVLAAVTDEKGFCAAADGDGLDVTALRGAWAAYGAGFAQHLDGTAGATSAGTASGTPAEPGTGTTAGTSAGTTGGATAGTATGESSAAVSATTAGTSAGTAAGATAGPDDVWAAASDGAVLLVGSKMGVLDHNVAAGLKPAAVACLHPIPYTTRALVNLQAAGAVVLADFVCLAGPLFAAWPGELADLEGDAVTPEAIQAAAEAAIADLVQETANHPDGAFLGACHHAESFLRTWRPALPFGRPLAA